MDALEQVIELLGSQEALASKLKIRSPSISEWRKRGRVPAERCREIENLVGKKVTRYDLRPDVFGKQEKAA